MFGGCYANRRVLLTGYTGFKGSWLALWLTRLGANVTGIALPPQSPSHWDALKLDIREHHQDIRDADALAKILKASKPEIVFHLAAQPLVRESYRDPLTTWSTNVMGTANLLEACRATDSVRAIVVATTDKCYENKETTKGYTEDDRLGGHDPYSASKAGAELVASSYRDAFFSSADSPLVATARAGNVIGGGDWSHERLIPDIIRAYVAKETLVIRHPNAIRPWQHVLESLSGYLLLGQNLLEGKKETARAWNLGSTSEATVETLLQHFKQQWPELQWNVSPEKQLHETTRLLLDSTLAQTQLGWKNMWDLPTTLDATTKWYEAYRAGRILSEAQLASYEAML